MSYDVFISYNGADLGHVNMLDAELRKLGKTVWLDKREIAVGVPIEECIRAGVRASTFLCPILTSNYQRSWWTGMETEAMKMREGLLAPTRILPCLFDGVPPMWFGGKAYADFRSSFSTGLKALLGSMDAALREQGKRKNVGRVAAGAGAAAIALWALSPSKSRERCRGLLGSARATRLAAMVRLRGHDAGKKYDNIDTLVGCGEDYSALLDEAFTVDDLRDLARAEGLDPAGRKASVIKSLLEVG